jgi:hypothetical protein
MDFRLHTGKKLGDATKAELAAEAAWCFRQAELAAEAERGLRQGKFDLKIVQELISLTKRQGPQHTPKSKGRRMTDLGNDLGPLTLGGLFAEEDTLLAWHRAK